MIQSSFLSDDTLQHSSVTAQSRTTDPQTSHLAAAHHEQTGRATSNRLKVEREVTLHPGQTYREIAKAIGLDCVETMRRLNDLERANLVTKGPERPCTESRNGNRMTTWESA